MVSSAISVLFQLIASKHKNIIDANVLVLASEHRDLRKLHTCTWHNATAENEKSKVHGEELVEF